MRQIIYLVVGICLVIQGLQPRIASRTVDQWGRCLSRSPGSDEGLLALPSADVAVPYLKLFGQKSIPSMIEVLQDPNAAHGWPGAIEVLSHHGKDAKAAIPVLIDCLSRVPTEEQIATVVKESYGRFGMQATDEQIAWFVSWVHASLDRQQPGDPAPVPERIPRQLPNVRPQGDPGLLEYLGKMVEQVADAHVEQRIFNLVGAFQASRRLSARALGNIGSGDPTVVSALLDAVKTDGNIHALVALGELDAADAEVKQTLLDVLDGKDEAWVTAVQQAGSELKLDPTAVAIQALGRVAGDDQGIMERLVVCARQGSLEAALAIAACGQQAERFSDELKALAKEGSAHAAVALALHGTHDTWLANRLYELLNNGGYSEEILLLEAIGQLAPSDPKFVELLEKRVDDYEGNLFSESGPTVANAALFALERSTNDPKYVQLLKRRISPPAINIWLRTGVSQHEQAIRYLGLAGHPASDALPRLTVIGRNPYIGVLCGISVMRTSEEAVRQIRSGEAR
jgi:hypothetical protein